MKLLLIASLILNCTSALKFFNFIKINTGKNAWKNSIAATFIAVGICGQSVNAFGPVEVSLSNLKYKQVELCDGKKPIMPGQKAAQGLFPVCIEVDADATNPGKDSLKDVSVYGFIKDNYAGNSVLPNNPDFKSDAGQYAMIKSVPPGESRVTFQFVAAVVTDPKVTPISDTSLTFFKTKAVSFPGGDRFKALDVCDVDPSS
eukprot:gene7699-15755_t